MWLAIFFALSATACILSALVSLSAANRAAHALESVQRRLSLCESRTESLDDSHKQALTLLQDLANRIKMQRVRSAALTQAKETAEPDPYTQPDEWRKMMSKRLAESRTGMKL